LTTRLIYPLSDSIPHREIGRPLVPPALFVDLGSKAGRHPRSIAFAGAIAFRAWSAWRAAAAGMFAIPRLVRMVLTYPAGVLAEGARH
jgi:hypothetical protein